MSTLLLLAQLAPPVTSFWPTSGAVWLTMAAAAVALGLALYDRLIAKGKRDAELNGFGDRVRLLEEWQARFDQSATERALIMERLTAAQESLLRQIGAAEASAAACHTDTEKMERTLVGEIRGLADRFSIWERRITLTVNGLEIELRSRGILSAQPPAPPPLPLPLPRDGQ